MTWQLVGNIAGKTPRDGKDGTSVDPAIVEAMVTRAVAAFPAPRDGKDGKDGRDGAAIDPMVVDALVAKAVAALPVPRDGKDGASVDPAVVEAMIAKAVAALPVPRDGKDGASVDPAVVEMMIAKAVAALPPPKDGKDGRDGTVDLAAVEMMVSKAVAALPVPKNGKDGASVEIADVEPVIATHVERAIAARPLPKDGANGVGIASAVVDRAGHLVLMLTDGTTKDVGPVVGRDGDADEMRAIVAESVSKAIDAIPIPKDGKDGRDGKDGLGFEDWSWEHDAEGRLYARVGREDVVKTARVPGHVDRGVWRMGELYLAGDCVTWGGGYWVALQDTRAKPGDPSPESRAWRLAVKAGKDGKPGPPGPRGGEDDA